MTTQSKHTPGPWHTKPLTYNTESGFAVFRTEEKPNGIRTHRIDKQGEFTEANAKLIAAAPEMLELLKRASGSLQAYCVEVNGDMNDSLATEIDLLITKVEGN